MRKLISLFLVLAAAASVATAAGASSGASQATIVGVASGDKRFSTLVSLVKKAKLVNTLSGDGPFTVFAPTNQAFTNLKKSNPMLYKQVTTNTSTLKAVLTYHVIAKRIPAAAAVTAAKATSAVKTVQGERTTLTYKNGNIMLNKAARVIIPDVKASNGIIHAINAVIVPPSLAS